MMKNDISPASISENLTTEFVGRHILYYLSIPSTMGVAKDVAERGAAEGTAILAEEQTAGRGRLGRSWLSPRGSIAVSIILRPSLEHLTGLNMVASLAVVHSIETVTGLKSCIKWPNDILIEGRKVSGILIENALRGEVVDWAILGIGLNVNFDPQFFPEIAPIATSLSAELKREVPRQEVLKCLFSEIESLYLALRRGESIYKEWQNRLETLGKMIRVKSGNLIEEGYAEGADKDGSLFLRRSDGTLVQITFGEVTLQD
jgi:BirA family biotin operon repressor/biotin-[acetyl-CoA-carboxylase] ligase